MNNMEGVNLIQSELEFAISFIEKYHAIGKCHMVEFLATKQWERLISPKAQKQIKDHCGYKTKVTANSTTKICSSNDESSHTYCIQDFSTFYTHFQKNNVGNSKVTVGLSTILKPFDKQAIHKTAANITTKEFMCPKKSHEVEEMSEVIHMIGQSVGTNTVLDIGAGKGYLGSYLSLRHGMRVIGVDCSDTNSKNAMERADKFTLYWKKLLKNKIQSFDLPETFNQLQFESVTATISDNVDVGELVNTNQATTKDEEVVICGLHACGDLSSSILRCFVSNEHCKAACVVGCCYHWLSEKAVEKGVTDSNLYCFPMSKYLTSILTFELGRNTRMLSLRALQKTAATSIELQGRSEESLFFRAVLSLILEEHYGIPATSKEIRIGGIYKKCNGFVEYIRKALKILKLPQDKVSDEEILKYHEENRKYESDIRCFNTLRSLLGSVVEHAILLDRLLYLHECGIPNTHLVQLFDPVLSPRCYAIIAWKGKI